MAVWTPFHERAFKLACNSHEFHFMGEEWIRNYVSRMEEPDLKRFKWLCTELDRRHPGDVDYDEMFISSGEELFDTNPWDNEWHPGVIINLEGYWDMIHTQEFCRLGQIHQLGPIQYIYQFLSGNDRFVHSLITLHWARVIADVLGLEGKKRKLVELDAFLHDIGHLTGGHATENYLNQIGNFSHEKFGVSQLKRIRKHIEKHGIKLEELIPVFLEQNPLSDIISGQVGADRLAYAKHDLARVIDELYRRKITPEVPFPLMENIAKSFTFAEGKYIPQVSAVEDVANLIELRSLTYSFFYFNRNVEIAEVIFSKVLAQLGINSPKELVKYSDHWLKHRIFSSKERPEVVKAFRGLEMGYVPPYAASLKLEEGMPKPDNRNMSDGMSFKTIEYPGCYAEQITEMEKEELRRKYPNRKAVRMLENKLMETFGLSRMEVYVCSYIQRDVEPKDVHMWDGKKMVNLHDKRPDLRKKHRQWMKENYGFRIAVAEEHHAKVMEYFSRKKNLLKFVMDAV